MRHITPQGLELITTFEGFSPTSYMCAGGYLTIGYGHVIKEGEAFPSGITEEEARTLLRKDVHIAERVVLQLICVPLSDGQFDALVSFTFNLGSGALQRSTLRQKLNRSDYGRAANEFGRWTFAGGRKLPGLIRRRAAERQRFLCLDKTIASSDRLFRPDTAGGA